MMETYYDEQTGLEFSFRLNKVEAAVGENTKVEYLFMIKKSDGIVHTVVGESIPELILRSLKETNLLNY